MTPIGVGIVGLSASSGWAATTHVPALHRVKGLELRGLTASSPASTERSARAHGVRGYADAAALVASQNVDLVVVSVKAPDHAALVECALDAGKPVYCEWPLATSTAEATFLAQRTADAGVRGFVGLQGRSSPVLRRVRDLISAGYVGEVLATTVDATGLMGSGTVDARRLYQLDPAHGATVLSIPVAHILDAVEMILGRLRGVSATTAVRRPQVTQRETGHSVPSTSVDHVAVSGLLATGAVLSLACRGGSSRAGGLRWGIWGSDGELVIEGNLGLPQMAELTVRGAHGAEKALLPLDVTPDDVGIPHRVACLAAAYEAVRVDLLEGSTQAPDFAHAVSLHEALDVVALAATRSTPRQGGDPNPSTA